MHDPAAETSDESLIECINSIVKRKMENCALSFLDATKTTELICRVIAHNLRRVMDLEFQGKFI